MKLRLTVGALVGCLVAAAAGCSSERGGGSSREDDVRPVERAIIGAPTPYDPDRTLDAKKDALDASQKARREVAWKAVAKILRDKNLADDGAVVGGKRAKIPAFRT